MISGGEGGKWFTFGNTFEESIVVGVSDLTCFLVGMMFEDSFSICVLFVLVLVLTS
jgi:hypothetical protein